MPTERRLKTTLQLDNSTGKPRRWAVVDHQGPIITACLGTRREERAVPEPTLSIIYFSRAMCNYDTLRTGAWIFKVQKGKKTKEWTKNKDDASVFPVGWHIHSGRKDWARCALPLSLSPLQPALMSHSRSQRFDISVRTDWGQKRENEGYIGHMFACIRHAINL